MSDEELADLQTIVGTRRQVWPQSLAAEPHAVARFALGVGDDNPRRCDPREITAVLPTFLYAGVNFGSYPASGHPAAPNRPTVTLWMRDIWTWHRAILPGEGFAASSRIDSVEERVRDGRRQGAIITEHVDFRDGADAPLALLERSTITMLRSPDAASTSTVRPLPDGAQLGDVAQSYAAEAGRRRGDEPLWWDDIALGDPVGPIAKGPLTVTNLVGFAMGWGAPLCPTNRVLFSWTRDNPAGSVQNLRTGWPEGPEGIHWDPDVYGAFGYASGFDFGPQRISWAAHLVTDWCGDAGRLLMLDTRLLRPNFLGDVTWFCASVSALEPAGPDEGDAVLAIEGTNHLGELTTVATARVRLPRRS